MTEPNDSLLHLFRSIVHVLTLAVTSTFMMSQCSKKKKPARGSSDDGMTLSARKTISGEANHPKAPADKVAVAGTHDPNYQTLAGVDGNCFEEKGGAEKDKASPAGTPKAGGPGMAATHDPNYQTLAGLGNDCFDKKGGEPKASPSPNAAGTPKAGGPGMAATHDPNYQTLAGIGNDCFDKKK